MSEESRAAFEKACAEYNAQITYQLRCADAIRDHLGGKPELVGEVLSALRGCASSSELYDIERAHSHARAILSRIDHG